MGGGRPPDFVVGGGAGGKGRGTRMRDVGGGRPLGFVVGGGAGGKGRGRG